MIYAGEFSPTEPENGTADDVRGVGPAESIAETAKPKKVKKLPVCIQTGEAKEPERMMRFVIGPDGLLYPDFAENLPGDAFWCSLDRPTLQDALDSRAFQRAAGRDVSIRDDILTRIEQGLRRQALSLLSMTRKAGHMVTGAEKTEQILRSGKAGVYLTAAAKDADTREKLSFLARDARIVDIFTSDELSGASGANNVYHAAMTRGGTTDRFFVHVKRIHLFNKTRHK